MNPHWLTAPKFSHTHYQALGPELIPVYRQLACRWLFKSSPGGRLPLLSARPEVTFPAEERRHPPLTDTKLYCLVTESHKCEQLAQGYAALSSWELNRRPIDRKSNTLPSYTTTPPLVTLNVYQVCAVVWDSVGLNQSCLLLPSCLGGVANFMVTLYIFIFC